MAYNPNLVFISPSSLADFEKCPQLYYFRNIYRSPRGLKIQIINQSLALGQAVHDTLEIFTKLLPGERNKETMFEKFEFIWGYFKGDKGGFVSLEEEESYKQRALQMLNRFLSNEHFMGTEAVKIPDFPKVELGDDLVLTGRLDWLEKDEQGYHLIDFKTGKNEEKEDSLQLPIYSVLVNGLFNGEKIRASYWYLDKEGDLVNFNLPLIEETRKLIKQKGEIIKMARQTASYRCQSGKENCWACKDMMAVANGKGKLVNIDPVNRKQEIYILVKDQPIEPQPVVVPLQNDLPF